MRSLAVALLLSIALAAAIVLLARPDAEASPDATITVNSTLDTDARDGVITLREAMLLATGGLAVGTLDEDECGQVSNSSFNGSCSTTDSIGAASADTIDFDGGEFNPGTITLTGVLPTLSTGDDTVDGSSAGVIVDGDDKSFDCFDIISANNTMKGLEIYNCRYGIYIHSGAQGNTVGGSTSSERNIISGNSSYGVRIEGNGTDSNTVKGNYVGLNAWGTSPPIPNGSGVGVDGGAQNNTVGGTSSGERNVISGNTTYGVFINGSGTDNNVVKGNYIGVTTGGDLPMGNRYGVYIASGQGNTVGGSTADERNVISAHSCTGDCSGVVITSANNNTISGNYIGTDATGTIRLDNEYGVRVLSGQGNVIGGSTSGERNVISRNHWGIEISGSSATGNVVRGNYIGIDATGTANLGNWGFGVWVRSSAHNNTVGGSMPSERNVISGNSTGVMLEQGANGNTVLGNYVGTNAAGDAAIGNSYIGIRIDDAYGNVIGAGNVVSGSVAINGGGIYIIHGSNSNTVKGNHIGTTASGDAPLANSYGVQLGDGSQNNTVGGTAVGDGNIIAYNSGPGVWVLGGTTTGNTITRNSIHSNGKGIETASGGNMELAPPVIDGVGSASGHTNPKCYPCTVEVFSDSEDEGRIYHGSTTTNDDTTGTWSFSGALAGPNITATAIHADGNTSEFSAPVAYPPPPPVGGMAELPDVSGSSALSYVALAALAAAALLALTAGAWYARRRWLG